MRAPRPNCMSGSWTSPQASPRSSSRTVSARCGWPSGSVSSATAGSSSRAPMRTCSTWTAGTPGPFTSRLDGWLVTAMRNHVRALWMLLSYAVRADPRQALLVLALTPVSGATGVALGLGLKQLVDAAATGSPGGLAAAAAILATTVAATSLIGTYAATRRLALQQRIGMLMDRRVLELCTGLPTLEHHESPEYLDRLQLLRTTRGMLGSAFGAPVEALRIIVRFGGTLGLLAALDPRLMLLPVLALPVLAASTVGQRIMIRVDERTAEPDRARWWLLGTATSASAAKELRVYRLEDELTGRHGRLLSRIHRAERVAETRSELLNVTGSLIFGLGFLGAIALVLYHAAHGRATPGEVALVVALAAQIDGDVTGTAQIFGSLQQALRTFGYYLWLSDHARDRMDPASGSTPPPGPGVLTLDQVSFRYPGTDQPILEDVSLRLPPGSTVALVGENGAGKTT